jgi:hypothetical protein
MSTVIITIILNLESLHNNLLLLLLPQPSTISVPVPVSTSTLPLPRRFIVHPMLHPRFEIYVYLATREICEIW